MTLIVYGGWDFAREKAYNNIKILQILLQGNPATIYTTVLPEKSRIFNLIICSCSEHHNVDHN